MRSICARAGALLLAIVCAATLTNASAGDDLPEFQHCVKNCIARYCEGPNPLVIPLHLRLLTWSCPSDCDYQCQRTVTAERIASGEPVEQFHGKWPFLRVLGFQEPFSVIFSILNGYQHLAGLRHVEQELSPKYAMRKYYIVFAYLGMVCWFFSSVFHTRDTDPTERLDYFGAGALVLYGLYYAPIRIFRWYGSPRHAQKVQIWTAFCACCYLAHVYYLQFVIWDYTYNMAINVVVGLSQNALWIYYSFLNYERRKPWSLWPVYMVIAVMFAMSLELLDFPPVLDFLDAHSLWHAATIIPMGWWYRFLVLDGKYEMVGERLKA